MSPPPGLCLASMSPRRRDILTALGLEFSVKSTEIDETRLDGESPEQMVLRLARAKAEASSPAPGTVVLAADTAVVLGETVLGKPLDRDDAVAMLLRLSGRTHRVLTGVALCAPDRVRTALTSTDVRFRDIGRDEATAVFGLAATDAVPADMRAAVTQGLEMLAPEARRG